MWSGWWEWKWTSLTAAEWALTTLIGYVGVPRRSQNAKTPLDAPPTTTCGWVGCWLKQVTPTKSIARWQVLEGWTSVDLKSHILTWPRVFPEATWSCFRKSALLIDPLSASVKDLRGAWRLPFSKNIWPLDPTDTIWSPAQDKELHEPSTFLVGGKCDQKRYKKHWYS